MPKLTIVLDRRDIERCYTSLTNTSDDTKSFVQIPFDPCPDSRKTPTVKSENSAVIKDTKRCDETKKHAKLNVAIKRKRNRPKKPECEKKKPGPTAKNLTLAERKLRYNYGVCPICGKYSKRLQTHVKAHKEGDELVECDYCHRKLVGKRNLRPHFDCHFKERLV